MEENGDTLANLTEPRLVHELSGALPGPVPPGAPVPAKVAGLEPTMGLKRRGPQSWGRPTFTGPFPIQALPGDLLAKCLARVPGRAAYGTLGAVCASWRAVLASPAFYEERRQAGLLAPCLLAMGRPPERSRGAFTGELFDVRSGASFTYASLWPGLLARRRRAGEGGRVTGLGAYRCVAVGFEVFLVGGDFDTHIHNPVLNTWRDGARMLVPRREFACGVIGGRIYVAGGIAIDDNRRLFSAEAYDVHADTWRFVADMPELRAGCKGEVVNGRLYVVGDQSTFAPNRTGAPSMLVYDPQKDRWHHAAGLPDNRWYFATTVLGGQLCVTGGGRIRGRIAESQPCWADLLLYDERRDTWHACSSRPAGAARGGLPSGLRAERMGAVAAPFHCASAVCGKLRREALSLHVLLFALGDAIYAVLAGDQLIARCLPRALGGLPSCALAWSEGGVPPTDPAGSGLRLRKKRTALRLRQPWYGHFNSIAAVMEL